MCKPLPLRASSFAIHVLTQQNASPSKSARTLVETSLVQQLQKLAHATFVLASVFIATVKLPLIHAAVTLEVQLAEAKSSNAQLQGEVEKLNDTVFSKTFRAPSAWAEREVKYKMEKKDWDTQVSFIPYMRAHTTSSGTAPRCDPNASVPVVAVQGVSMCLHMTAGTATFLQ